MSYTADLIVPIEMIAECPSSSDTAEKTFRKTSTNLDPANYDGTCTYYFEVVAQNLDASNGYDIHLYDQTNSSEVATCPVDANQTDAKRIRSSSFVPAEGNCNYRVRLHQTSVASDLKVFSARIVVVQVGATKTRIQIPLLTKGYATVSSTDPSNVYVNSTTTYTASASYCVQWKRNDAAWGTVGSYDFEALFYTAATGTAYATLYNVTDDAAVAASELSTSDVTESIQEASFSSDDNWDDGDVYEVRIKNTGGVNCLIVKSALYINLTGMTKGEVYWLTGKYLSSASAISLFTGRLLYEAGSYSSPVLYHEVTSKNLTSAEVGAQSYDGVLQDTSNVGSSEITSARVTIDTTKTVYPTSRSAFTAPASGNRIFCRHPATTYVTTTTADFIVIAFTGTEEGTAFQGMTVTRMVG